MGKLQVTWIETVQLADEPVDHTSAFSYKQLHLFFGINVTMPWFNRY